MRRPIGRRFLLSIKLIPVLPNQKAPYRGFLRFCLLGLNGVSHHCSVQIGARFAVGAGYQTKVQLLIQSVGRSAFGTAGKVDTLMSCLCSLANSSAVSRSFLISCSPTPFPLWFLSTTTSCISAIQPDRVLWKKMVAMPR